MKRKHPYHNGSPTDLDGSLSLSRWVLFGLVALSLAGVFLILRPFLAPIILALLLVSIFHPMHRWLRKTCRRPNMAAFLSVVIILLLVLIPLLLFLTALAQQGIEVFKQAQTWLSEGNLQESLEGGRIQQLWEHPQMVRFRDFLAARFPATHADQFNLAGGLMDLSKQSLQFVGERLLPILTKTGLVILNFGIMLFVMFYSFRDGDKMLHYLFQMFPLAASYQQTLLHRVRYIARAVVLGTLLTASAQALLAMLAFRMVGIPALFWGVMLGIASLLPVVGTALVTVPATIYLLITGNHGGALFLFFYSIFVIGMADNFLRPWLMQGQSGMSMLVLFFAILGGIRYFGPIGIVYGPLIFGLCAMLLYIYRVENLDALKQLEHR